MVLSVCFLSVASRPGGHGSDTTTAVDEIIKRRHSLSLLRLGFISRRFVLFVQHLRVVCFPLVFVLVFVFVWFCSRDLVSLSALSIFLSRFLFSMGVASQ